MLKYIVSAAILAGLYYWTSQTSVDAAIGITLLCATSMIILLGLSQN